MTDRVVTIDFWNTMVVARTGGTVRQEARIKQLRTAVAIASASAIPDEALLTAYQGANQRLDTLWQEEHVTPTVDRALHFVWEALDLNVPGTVHQETVRAFEEGLLVGPPDLADGLPEALAALPDGVRLGIISDTRFSPGRVIRQYLDRKGIRQHFDGFVFSDETGVAKPERAAFEAAAEQLGTALNSLVHIGDLRRTDVAGAQQAGGTAILYTGVEADATATPEPHHVLPHWNELPALLRQLP